MICLVDEMLVKLLWIGVVFVFLLFLVIVVFLNLEIGILCGLFMVLFGMFWIWVVGVVFLECIGCMNWLLLFGMIFIGVMLFIVVLGGMGFFELVIDCVLIVVLIFVGGVMCVVML